MTDKTPFNLSPTYVQTSSLLNLATNLYNIDLTPGSHTTFMTPINTGSASGTNVHGLIRENGSEVQFTANMSAADISTVLKLAIETDEQMAKKYPVGSAQYTQLMNGSSLS